MNSEIASTRYRVADVDGVRIFYREAGDPSAPTLLLLHGFPTAGHMFRDLIPLLAGRFHLIAPDFPSFGQSAMPDRDSYTYTFSNLTTTISAFIELLLLERFAIYAFDFGMPVGLRIALKHPEKIIAIISQNGNAYEMGLSDKWEPMRVYWKDGSQANRDALRDFLKPESTTYQYTQGVSDSSLVSPDGRSLDDFYLARPGADEIQLDLLKDYASNVALYSDFQTYFRRLKPPLLAVWGENDPFFRPVSAEAFKIDIPTAIVEFFDTGHFALETHCREIADAIIPFLEGAAKKSPDQTALRKFSSPSR